MNKNKKFKYILSVIFKIINKITYFVEINNPCDPHVSKINFKYDCFVYFLLVAVISFIITISQLNVFYNKLIRKQINSYI